jgi:prepilin-type N-terminal cleavage/methylation domain-containing protein
MKKTGFTLVELLVVIAIIALLMSILMPALARTRRQAKAIVCMANLRQWALIWQMYTSDHEGYFNAGDEGTSFEWMETIQPYTKEKDLYCCPIAVKRSELWYGVMGTTNSTWEWTYPSGEYFLGSYGINEFCFDPPDSIKIIWGHPAKLNWRHINYKNAGDIPMLVDCSWAGGAPNHSDEPPPIQGAVYEQMYTNNMKRFCLDRHDGHVNGAFMDFSARKIGLKELWKLKWHRQFDINGGPIKTEWPQWMKNFKDYE